MVFRIAGVTHWLTGISLQTGAYLWCALLMAGTCALWVDICRRWVLASGYLVCLVVLATPGFNKFRGDIIREFGFWFFYVLALWVGRWQQRQGWLPAGLIQLVILRAAAFRLEAVLLVPVLALWQLSAWRRQGGRAAGRDSCS